MMTVGLEGRGYVYTPAWVGARRARDRLAGMFWVSALDGTGDRVSTAACPVS